MLHRRTPDGDAVAAAQRRLAAISAQFASTDGDRPAGTSSQRADSDERSDEPGVSDAVSDDAAGLEPARGFPRTDSGRHAGSAPAGRYGRWGLSAHQVAILAVAALALVTVAAWWVLHSVPRAPVQLASERSLPAPTAATAAPESTGVDAEPAVSTPASAPTSPVAPPVVVDVAGKVRHPGIVELPAGARVVDALDAAGGARVGVDTRSLNLARPLVDGEQIVVGYDVPSMAAGQVPAGGAGQTGSAPTSTGEAIAPVGLNTATAEQLETIPGIGPVTAQAILAWRTEHGAFTTVDQLLDVSGIGDATLAEMIPYVYV